MILPRAIVSCNCIMQRKDKLDPPNSPLDRVRESKEEKNWQKREKTVHIFFKQKTLIPFGSVCLLYERAIRSISRFLNIYQLKRLLFHK